MSEALRERPGFRAYGPSGERLPSQAEREVLGVLSKSGQAMRPVEIAAAVGAKRPSMCRHLLRMERRGLIASRGGWYYIPSRR